MHGDNLKIQAISICSYLSSSWLKELSLCYAFKICWYVCALYLCYCILHGKIKVLLHTVFSLWPTLFRGLDSRTGLDMQVELKTNFLEVN